MRFLKLLLLSLILYTIYSIQNPPPALAAPADNCTIQANPIPLNINDKATFTSEIGGTNCDHGNTGTYELKLIRTTPYDAIVPWNNEPNLNYSGGKLSKEINLNTHIDPGITGDVQELCVQLLWNNAIQTSEQCFPAIGAPPQTTNESCQITIHSIPQGDFSLGETLTFHLNAENLDPNQHYQLDFVAHGAARNPDPITIGPLGRTTYNQNVVSKPANLFGITSNGNYHNVFFQRGTGGTTICEKDFLVYEPGTTPYKYDPCSGIKDPDQLDACVTCTSPTIDGVPQGTYTAIGCIPTEPQAFVSIFIKWAISVGGGIAFLLIIYGAFTVITAAGEPEKLKAGQETITSAITGILFIIFAIFLLRFIGVDLLKIPGFG